MPKIRDQNHLEGILEKEKKKLGIEDKTIRVKFSEDEGDYSSSEKIGENTYQITICEVSIPQIVSNPNLRRGDERASLRHELYHIADGHCDKTFPDGKMGYLMYWLYYLLYAEPRAEIYTNTGWKLGVKSKK